MNNSISKLSRLLLVISAIGLIVSVFVPIWRIELNAPQYPEGLMMQIFSYKLGGQVEIINGLNHYIGMGTLHTENFIEFTILPYLIGFFALLFLTTAFIAKRKLLNVTLISFVLFGIIAMIDFYRWEYEYGHNLDPKAAIIVPGMAYQPPLIGYKKLLNFEAFSIPDIGGWLFILAGALVLFAFLKENKFSNRFIMNSKKVVATCMLLGFLQSCNQNKPEPIVINSDKCDYCQMVIADGKFGAELVTEKSKVFKFDDFHCMLDYSLENTKVPFKAFYVNDYMATNNLLDATKCFYIKHENIRSPMGSNVAAFSKMEDAEMIAAKHGATVLDWSQIQHVQTSP